MDEMSEGDRYQVPSDFWQKKDAFIIIAMKNYWRKLRDMEGGGKPSKHTNPFTSFWDSHRNPSRGRTRDCCVQFMPPACLKFVMANFDCPLIG